MLLYIFIQETSSELDFLIATKLQNCSPVIYFDIEVSTVMIVLGIYQYSQNDF